MMKKHLTSIYARAAVAATSMIAAGAAMAEPVPIDFSTITGSIDMTTVVAGVLAVAGLVMVLTLAVKGSSTISSTVKKA